MQSYTPGTLHCGKLSLNRDWLPTGTRRSWRCNFNPNHDYNPNPLTLTIHLTLTLILKLLAHNLALIWSCPWRFKFSLPHCNVPKVLNWMSGRLSVFPSLYWRYLSISYENYNYWQNSNFKHSRHTVEKVSGNSHVISRESSSLKSEKWHKVTWQHTGNPFRFSRWFKGSVQDGEKIDLFDKFCKEESQTSNPEIFSL